jgi:hypothetical protein
MHSTNLRRTAALVGAATAITVTTTLTTMLTATGSAASSAPDEAGDRPCFMVRAHWNTALDGPQPTCATPSWQLVETPPRFPVPAISARVVDYMP